MSVNHAVAEQGASTVDKNKSAPKTVIEHIISRLVEIGITDVFGVAGDFAFPINDAVCDNEHMRWIGSCNELNAAYSADGYARIRSMSALCTTYGVGELGAIAGVAGAYAENLPIFHLVGMLASRTQSARRLVHHTLGNGEFELFHHMTGPVVCASAIITPQNCATEMERLIAAAMYHRRPVYIAIPTDHATSPLLGTAEPYNLSISDHDSLTAATKALLDAIHGAQSVCVVPGIILARAGLKEITTRFLKASNLPFVTMFMDKAVVDETLDNYVGMYDGQLMNEEVRQFVERSDLAIGIGAALTDFNSGSFMAKIETAKSANIMLHSVRVGEKVFNNVEMKDVIAALASQIEAKDTVVHKKIGLDIQISRVGDKISAEYLYPRWQQMLKEGDILVAETGTSSMGMGFASMPRGSTFHNQALWGAIGWATPASFGASLAAPERRTILITGDGSHQLTAQEIGQFHRFNLKPIVFVLNNDGYLIERLLCKNPESAYNDVAQWKYHELPQAFGCKDWFTTKVTTCDELDAAIQKAEASGTGAYIEVVTDRYAASPLALKLQSATQTLYS
ncbi:hypothetical protein FSST1_009758 [Fusarium sambucinum]